MKKKTNIRGNLDVLVQHLKLKNSRIEEVIIHGDPAGLRSLARLFDALAEVQYSNDLSVDGIREHLHLEIGKDLARSSVRLVVGRLDDANGKFYKTFKKRNQHMLSFINPNKQLI